ncbi:hypothetical protein RB595_001478 [Gaeumannomyces hyphopodioides]
MLGSSDRRAPPRLATLAPELLDEVLGYLVCSDISRLSRTCWDLYAPLLPRLLGDPENNKNAVRWACRAGVDGLIDKLVDYGAPISTVATERANLRVLTLTLAARSGQVGTFQHLIELGAQVDCPGVGHSAIRTLVRSLARSPSPDLLRIFLEANPSLVSQLHQHQRTELLFHAVDAASRERNAWAFSSCLGIARKLIAAGADPNPSPILMRYPIYRYHVFLPTLSVAIRSRSPELVRLLLESGARVDSQLDTMFTVMDTPPEQASPAEQWPEAVAGSSPMCAVAYWLAQTLSTTEPSVRAQDFRHLAEIGHLCLEHGAAVNDIVAIQGKGALCLRTPLTLYVAMVKDWRPPDGQPESDAMQRLRYLHGIGAAGLLDTPRNLRYEITTRASQTKPTVRRQRRYCRMWGARQLWMSPAHLLMKLWSPFSSALPALVQPLKLLMSKEEPRVASHLGPPHGHDGPSAAELLAIYRYPEPTEQLGGTRDHADPVMSAWESILANAIQRLNSTELDRLLSDYIWLKLTCANHYHETRLGCCQGLPSPWYSDSECCKVAASADDGFTRPTIRQLVAAGADVNRRFCSRGPTWLQNFGLWLTDTTNRHNRPQFERMPGIQWGHFYTGLIGLTEERARLLRYLIDECGADPTIPHNGQTTAEILRQRLEKITWMVHQGSPIYERLIEFDWGRPGGYSEDMRRRFILEEKEEEGKEEAEEVLETGPSRDELSEVAALRLHD